ncbi:SEC14 domain and spectrin repeat-containing protein 1 [Mizuhopecten yessoensis]|uniref:SEC14 domain and spectrin repeat-containing protein 1 n=1 Tax=Mizuhopecten yessoensis TaxID=6573 RepID=A0A210Q6I3_MIZYE|nr:SEC14 domain and spectrin repeat-containing protein 1 [Mizuhopecten yessoensis]
MAYQGGGGGGVQNLSRQPSQQSLSRPNHRRHPQDDTPHGYRQQPQETNPQQSPYPSRNDIQRSQSQHNVYPQQSGHISRNASRQEGRQASAPSHHQSQPAMYHSQQQELRPSHHPSAPETQSPYMSHLDPGRYGSQQIMNAQQSPYPLRHELRHGESNQSLVRGSRQQLADLPQDPQNRGDRQFTSGPSDQYATVQKPHRDQGPVQRLFPVNHHESHQTMPTHSSQAYQSQPQSAYGHHQSHTSLSPDARPQGPERGQESSYPPHPPANQQSGQESEAPPPYYSRGHSRESSYVPQPDLSPPPQNFAQSQPFHSQPSYLGSEQGQAPSEGKYSPARAESQHIASHLARNESSRTQQSIRSHHSRASSLSNTPPIPEVRGKEASHIIDLLQREIVYITGGRDRNGGPVVTFPGHLPHPEPSQHDIMTCLQYYVQIPSEESKCRGFTAVVDSRDGSWPNMVTVLGCLKKMLGEYIKQVLVIKSDPNIDRKSSNQSFRRDRNSPNLEPQFISVNRLYEFVDKKELTGMFGGHLSYHHGVWLKNRQDLEKFIRESRAAASHLDTAEAQIQQAYSKKDSSSPLESLRQHRYFQDSIMSVPTQVIRDGGELLSQLRRHRDPPQGQDKDSVWTLDDLEAQKQVKRLIQYIENRVEKLQNYLENRDRTLSLNLQYEELHRDIKTVVGWILGPGEKLLSSQVDIGDSYETANELRRRHEEMEIKCMDTYGQYAELRYKAEELTEEDHPGRDDIHSVRDYMDTVCRCFASRLERRRTLLITSVRFHRLAEDFSQKLDSLLELLCTETELVDVDTAEKALAELNEKCDSIDLAATQSIADGQSLLDEMSRPIKNASGKDISPDYDSQIKHINKYLEDLQERKMRCDDLADVRKLKLQQILQLRTCERDADQAIAWIRELCEVMLYTHTSMGHTPQEAEVLQEEHKKFESTAEGTYDYGKQLLQAAFVLRRSLRIDLAPNEERVVQLEEAWTRFTGGSNERANRLTVAAMFLSSAEKLFDQLEQLMKPVSQALAMEITAHDVLRHHTASKEHLESEYNDTNHMGRALLERLSLPIILVDRDNKQVSIDDQGASESIVGKLRKLDRQMQELNQGWEEMQQVRRHAVPQPPQRSSSQRSQTLPRSNTGSMRSNETPPQKSESMRRRPRQWTSEVDSRGGPSISEGRVSDPNQGRKVVREKIQKLSNAPQESAVSSSYVVPVRSQPLHQRSKSTIPAHPGVRTREGDRLYRQLEEVS